MNTLTEAYIDSLAPTSSTIKNGWGLVKKKQFINLHKSEDGTLLFGECSGSGKTPYATSVDFMKPDQPVFRCSCPSRQFPCKHTMALMYAFVSGVPFDTAPVPSDIVEKREKTEKREEKKKEASHAPRKTNKSALKKKLQAQLEGLDVLQNILYHLVRAGLASIDAKSLKQLEAGAKELGNYYVKEAQYTLREFTLLWKEKLPQEQLFSEASSKLTVLFALCKKGREHLQKRLADANLTPDITSSIEEWLGHTWQLTELRELDMVQSNVSLVQLSFTSYRSEARKEFVDEGVWVSLTDGNLYYTRNYRPFKAKQYVKEDDSIFSVLRTNELFIYPGEGNRRVRWEDYQLTEVTQSEMEQIREFAKSDFSEVVKLVKNQLKLPLADKHPLALLSFSKIGKIDGEWVIEDPNGHRLILADESRKLPSTLPLLSLLPSEERMEQAMLVQFCHNLITGALCVKPLSLISHRRIIRFMA